MNDVREQSFMKALFHGVIAEELVLPYPERPVEERERIKQLRGELRRFTDQHVDSVAIDRDEEIPNEVLEGLKALGLFGLGIPAEYGGLGLSATGDARIIEELGAIDSSLAVTLGAHACIGFKAIVQHGTEAQKRRYLPRLAKGELIASFALTEPGAGSDAASVTTRAALATDGGGWHLNGHKLWITNGGFADLFTVFARTSALESGEKPKMVALLVERTRGVSTGPSDRKMGVRGASTSSVTFEDVKVPAQNLLGETGAGFKVAMEVLNEGRLGLAARCLGGCKRALALSVERARERRAFGRPIGEFGIIKEKIARMACTTFALESMTYLTTGLVDARVPDYSLESAICKVFASETYWEVMNETSRIAAGIGYMRRYPYERLLRDARANLVFEGTNEILRAFIALAGMRNPGSQLADVERAMREPIKGFGILSDFAVKRARSAFGRERLGRVHSVLRKEAVLFEDSVTALARNSDRVLRKHGLEIAEMQLVQRRIAEVAIDIYALASVLSRTTAAIERRGEAGARREIDLTAAFAALAGRRLRSRLDDMERDEDELLKHVASRTYRDGGYPFDGVG